MKKNRLIGSFYLCCLLCFAINFCRAQECDYNVLINQAKAFISKGNYTDAINKFNSAKACDPTKSIIVDSHIQKLFAKIRKQKEMADNAKLDANRAKTKAQKAVNELKAEIQRTKIAEAKSDSTEKRRQKDLLSISNAARSGKSAEELAKLTNNLMKRGVSQEGLEIENNKQLPDSSNAQSAGNLVKTRESSRAIWKKIKITLDTLNELKPIIQRNHFNDPDFDYSLEAKIRDSICSDGDYYYKKLFFVSSKKIDSLLKSGSPLKFSNAIGEDILFEYLRSAYNYSWDRMDNDQPDSSIAIISKAEGIMNHIQPSAKFYFCLAGFENVKGHYSSLYKDSEKTYKHANKAIEYANDAALKQPGNKYYLKSLSTFLRNAKYNIPNFLSKEEKDHYLGLSAELAAYINQIDNKGFAGANTFYIVRDQIQDLADSNRYSDAEKMLKNSIQKFSMFIDNSPRSYSNHIYRAELYLEFANVRSKQNDTLSQVNYINAALDDWTSYIKGHSLLINDIDDFADTYNSTVTALVKVYKGDELIAKYQYISKTLDELKVFYAKQPPPIARILYYLNNFVGNYSLTNRDSVSALSYYSKATDGFENSRILDKYSTFSENYARFLLPFDKSITLNIRYDLEQKATDDYNKVKRIFLPIYHKYPWDVNISYYLADIDKRYGEYLYKKRKYKDAIEPLDSASFNGEKQSTEYLIKIYGATSHADATKLSYYKLRDQSQSKGIKEYTHAADFNGVQKNIIIEIFDRAKGYPYKGIEDQAKWWREARNGIIPRSLVEKFSKLQDTAWQKNISFKQLVSDRVNAETLAPYKDLKSKIDRADNKPKRMSLLDSLYNIYNTNLRKDAFNSDVVKADAVEFYLINGRYFLENRRGLTAQDLFNKVLKLDPNNTEAQVGIELAKHNNDINALVNTADSTELQSIMGLYLLGKSNTKNALVVINKIQSDLDRAYLKINATDLSAKNRLSNSYNDLAWHCLQLNITDHVAEYLAKSKELDPANLYPQENLPHFYLLTGQFEKAKQMYMELKDKEFDANNDLPTFKDGFLADLKEFKRRGIKNDGAQKMIDILDTN